MSDNKKKINIFEFVAEVKAVDFKTFEHKAPFAKVTLEVPESEWHKLNGLNLLMVNKAFNVVLSDDATPEF